MHMWRKNKDLSLNIKAASEYLEIEPDKLAELLLKRELVQNRGLFQDLFHFNTSVSQIESGSVLHQMDSGFELIRGFPKIRRAMILEPAIKKHFPHTDTICVEEKMNGYNIRIIAIDNNPVALTRKGYVCPYSTEKVREMISCSFFRDHPELVVYGEMVGPDNPYIPKDIYDVDSIAFFVFDIRHKKTGNPIPVDQRRKLAGEYGFRQVPYFGEFKKEEAFLSIHKLIRELGEKGREGVVIKDPQMIDPPVKYTSSQSNCADLEHAFEFYNDVGRDYIFSRVVREGFQAVEWEEDMQEIERRSLRLGKSILLPMIRTIRKVGQGERVSNDVQIRTSNLNTISELEQFFHRQGLEIIFSDPERTGDGYIVKIRKLNKSTNDKTDAVWKGDLW